MLRVPLHQLDARLPVPRYARTGDAGADLLARSDVVLACSGRAGRWSRPGVVVAIPAGYAGLVLPRSGLALRHGVTCLNAPGLIDSGYRGELQVVLVNHDPEHDYAVAGATASPSSCSSGSRRRPSSWWRGGPRRVGPGRRRLRAHGHLTPPRERG